MLLFIYLFLKILKIDNIRCWRGYKNLVFLYVVRRRVIDKSIFGN